MVRQNTPIPLQQVLLSYTLLFTLATTAWFALLEPASLRYRDQANKIKVETQRVHELERLNRQQVHLSTSNSNTQLDTLLRQATLDADTDVLAGTQMQQRIKTIVETWGGQIHDSQILTDVTSGSVGALINLSIQLNALKDVLRVIESQSPYLFVDRVMIRVKDRYLSPLKSDTTATELHLHLDVSAYHRHRAIKEKGPEISGN